MLVGEQPGDQEDLRGRPFQGPAGQLLRARDRELGWPADALYLTNAVKHFHHELRGKRRIHKTPGQQEAVACLHWLEAEIEALRPRAIVALGATAARSLLGRAVGVTETKGAGWRATTACRCWCACTLRPSCGRIRRGNARCVRAGSTACGRRHAVIGQAPIDGLAGP